MSPATATSTSECRSAWTRRSRAIRSVRPAPASQHRRSLPHRSRVHPQVGQPARGGRDHLEHQRGERRRRVGGPFPHRTVLSAAHRRHIQGRGQVGHDGVQQRLDPAVAVGRAAQHHEAVAAAGEVAQRARTASARTRSPARRTPPAPPDAARQPLPPAVGGAGAPRPAARPARGLRSAVSLPSAQVSARRRSRSTTPVNPSSRPIGNCTTSGAGCSRRRIESTAASRSAPARSSLLTNAMRGTPCRSACRHTASLCGSTPATASNTATAPSRTRSERSTSPEKSTCPGVSMRLIRWPFQPQLTAAAKMVIPRSRSWESKSVTVVPSWTSPRL